MGWVRLDDDFGHHPKIVKAGPFATLLWIHGIAYCNRYGTDGVIPCEALPTLLSWVAEDQAKTLPTCLELASRLLEANLWEEHKTENAYIVHDYAKYQFTRAASQAKKESVRAIRAEAGRKGGLARASNCLNATQAKPKQNSSPTPTPTPTPKNLNPERESAREASVTPAENERINTITELATPNRSPSGYDLAKTVWLELWQAKYKRPFVFALDVGPNSEDRILQRLGRMAYEQGKDRAETYCRHWVKAYLRSHGDRNYLDDHSHPLRNIMRDISSYGMPKAAPSRPESDDRAPEGTGESTTIRKLVSVPPSEPELSVEEQGRRAAEFARMMKKITGGAA